MVEQRFEALAGKIINAASCFNSTSASSSGVPLPLTVLPVEEACKG
jgi:hypothetical protein